MTKRCAFWLLLLFGICAGISAAAQDLPTAVLQLLTRANTWTALQTYTNGIKVNAFVPSSSALTLYTDGIDLFWGGVALSGGGSVTTPHNLLSTTHPDTLAGSVARGSIVVGNSTPKWAALAVCAAGSYVGSNGTDTLCRTDAGSFTNLPAANLTGALPAISGALLTALNATQLTSGTIPLARIVGLTNSQIDAAAAIVYSKLNLAGSVNMASDVTGTLPRGNGGTGLATSTDDNVMVGNGTVWQSKAVPDCDASTSALNYDVTTNAFSCRTLSIPSGTVTSVAVTVPSILSIAGSPITTSGTLAFTLATQTANTIFSGPTGGGAVAPTFRAMVNADLPLSGLAAGTYPSCTFNTRGVATSCTTTVNVSSQVTGVGGIANGMTGLATIGDDNIFLGSGATTAAAATIPNCTSASCWGVGYTQATNTFAAITARTIAFPIWLDAGLCQNATAVLAWSTPTTNPGVAACVTGSNTQKLVVDFADGANTLSIQRELLLTSDFTSTADAKLWWYTTATSGAVVWQVATACVATTETGDPSFNTASTVTSTAQGTTNQYNFATITGLTMTGCAAGEVLYVKVFRDPTNGSDTLAATARLIGVELTLRRSI